jgi:hypothetical protein
MWSLNLLLLAENAHMALAMWQTGMRDEAYRMLQGRAARLDVHGTLPGDFHMTSALDVHTAGGAARLRRSHRHHLARAGGGAFRRAAGFARQRG